MLSRVADAIYWMHRYIERAENAARFVDVNLNLLLDLPGGAAGQWAALVATTGDDALFRARYGDATAESVIHFLTFDAEYPNSIVSCLRAARENARTVREIISSEMWEQVNRTHLMVRDAKPADVLATPYEFFTAVKQASHLFVGITHLTMTHNEAWHFGRLGGLVERADKTSRIVDVKCFLLAHESDDPRLAYDEIRWGALLKSASALEMYRKRHGRISPANVVEFLLLDPEFPRSLRYCIHKAERSLRAITTCDGVPTRSSAEDRVSALCGSLEGWNAKALVAGGTLHQTLDGFQAQLNAVGGAIRESFFAPRLGETTEPRASSVRLQSQSQTQTQTVGSVPPQRLGQ